MSCADRLQNYIIDPTSIDEEFLTNCTSSINVTSDKETTPYGVKVYAYVIPVILTVGMLGNILSLYVFTSRPLRLLSGSVYLATLSVSDMVVLLMYILPDWLYKGLPYWPGSRRVNLIHTPYVCQVFLYVGYWFR